jgi:dihydroneopterin aldolase
MLISRHVFVEGLMLEAAIGVHDHEIGRKQPLIVDATIDLGGDAISGLKDTLNYEYIAIEAQKIIDQGHITLVEIFAEDLATALLAHPQVHSIEITVRKPEALKDTSAAGCSVVMARA